MAINKHTNTNSNISQLAPNLCGKIVSANKHLSNEEELMSNIQKNLPPEFFTDTPSATESLTNTHNNITNSYQKYNSQNGYATTYPFDTNTAQYQQQLATIQAKITKDLPDTPHDQNIQLQQHIDPRLIQSDPGMTQQIDPRLVQSDPRIMIQQTDPRMMQQTDPRMMMQQTDPRMMMQQTDPRMMQQPDPRFIYRSDPRLTQSDSTLVQQTNPRLMQQQIDPRFVQQIDPRMMQQIDPRMTQQIDPRQTQQQLYPRQMQQQFDPRQMQQQFDPRQMQQQQQIDPKLTHIHTQQSHNNKISNYKIHQQTDRKKRVDPQIKIGSGKKNNGSDYELDDSQSSNSKINKDVVKNLRTSSGTGSGSSGGSRSYPKYAQAQPDSKINTLNPKYKSKPSNLKEAIQSRKDMPDDIVIGPGSYQYPQPQFQPQSQSQFQPQYQYHQPMPDMQQNNLLDRITQLNDNLRQLKSMMPESKYESKSTQPTPVYPPSTQHIAPVQIGRTKALVCFTVTPDSLVAPDSSTVLVRERLRYCFSTNALVHSKNSHPYAIKMAIMTEYFAKVLISFSKKNSNSSDFGEVIVWVAFTFSDFSIAEDKY